MWRQAGLRLPRDGSGRGWRRIVLDPSVLRPLGGNATASRPPVCALASDAKLTSAAARSATPLGFAAVAWRCDGLANGLWLNASVPVGATAQLYLPSTFGETVTESGTVVFRGGAFVPGAAAGVVDGHASATESAYVIELSSGNYTFAVHAHASLAAAVSALPPAPVGWTLFPGHCMGTDRAGSKGGAGAGHCAGPPYQLDPGGTCPRGACRCPHPAAASSCIEAALAHCQATKGCRSISFREAASEYEMFTLANWSSVRNPSWSSYAMDSAAPPLPPPPPPPAPPKPCGTDLDCSLNGVCDASNGVCACDRPVQQALRLLLISYQDYRMLGRPLISYQDYHKCCCSDTPRRPWSGRACGKLQFAVTPASAKDICDKHNTWGGPIAGPEDGRYHAFIPLYKSGSLWGAKQAMHGVASSPTGPFTWGQRPNISCGINPAFLSFKTSSGKAVHSLWDNGRPVQQTLQKPSPYFVPGLPHVILIEWRQALVSYPD